MPRVAFYTLGCKLNYSETMTLQRAFEDRTFDVVEFGEPSDVLVVNTCTVTSEAERKARQTVRRALRENPETFVVVTGCYAQLRPEEIAEIDGVDAVLGAQEKFKLFQLIDTFTKAEETQVSVSCIDEGADFGAAFSTGDRTRAFLKVQDGCDYTCSFCTIPLARGASRSQSVEETVAQARQIASEGFKEIVISGVNIGLYGRDNDSDLLTLLRALDEVEGIDRYRISSIEPNLLTDEIIDFVASSRAFLPHFHLPLQSGDDYVLGKMRRRYRRDVYAERVARIREKMPHAAIGVDVIVGFPAETDERFETSYRFINELPVSYLHVFTYSERPDTTVVDRPDRVDGTDPVPKQVRSERNKKLRILSKKKEHAHYEAHLGTERSVLWETPKENGRQYGYTGNYIRVERPADPERENVIEKVTLDGLTERGTVSVAESEFVPLSLI